MRYPTRWNARDIRIRGGLLHAYPNMSTARDLHGIRGASPDPCDLPAGCRFHPRCTQVTPLCRTAEPPLVESPSMPGRLIACHLDGLQTLLHARDLHKAFSTNGNGHSKAPGRNGNGQPQSAQVEAVRSASLEVYEGEVVALVGETGSGKTTLGRLLVGLIEADGGHVQFEGRDLTELNSHERKALRRRIQFIAQDPFDAISPPPDGERNRPRAAGCPTHRLVHRPPTACPRCIARGGTAAEPDFPGSPRARAERRGSCSVSRLHAHSCSIRS